MQIWEAGADRRVLDEPATDRYWIIDVDIDVDVDVDGS